MNFANIRSYQDNYIPLQLAFFLTKTNNSKMSKTQDEVREKRIQESVIVDCNSEAEELTGWYHYMYDGLSFPIVGVANIPTTGNKTAKKKVKITGIDPKSEKGNPIRMGVVENGSRSVNYISPEYLERIETSDENLDIINDWLYWNDFELL
jgi:Calcium binding